MTDADPLPVVFSANGPHRDELARLTLEIRTDPSRLSVRVVLDHLGRPESVRLRVPGARPPCVSIAVHGAWPLAGLGPMAIADVLSALAARASAPGGPDDGLASFASLALATHEAEHGRPDGLREGDCTVEICLEEDGTTSFWIDPEGSFDGEGTRSLNPDRDVLAAIAGEPRIPFHAWSVDDPDGEILSIGPSMSDDAGAMVEAGPVDAMVMLRIHAMLAERPGPGR